MTEGSVINPLQTWGFFVGTVNVLSGWRGKRDYKPKKPKSPVCMTAAALASLAISLRADRRPRMSATHRIRPWADSSTFVCVLTWYWTRGAGDPVGLLEADAGLDPPCMAILGRI